MGAKPAFATDTDAVSSAIGRLVRCPASLAVPLQSCLALQGQLAMCPSAFGGSSLNSAVHG